MHLKVGYRVESENDGKENRRESQVSYEQMKGFASHSENRVGVN